MNGHRARVFAVQYHPTDPHLFVTGGWDDTVQVQQCQFSGLKLIKYGKNMDKRLIVSKDRLDSGKGLDNPSLKTVYKH